MNLISLIIVIGSIAVVLTLVIGLIYKKHKSWIMTFFQNFTGVLFIFSGWVKAVDPLGTAYKLEQYFAEFEAVFEGTWFSFLSGIFPLFSEYSISFSVLMIVFEIVLGLMLLLGAKTKFSAWAFLLLVIFFTFLTGFTYLTGYVPGDGKFFTFSSWGPYLESNMKVTDCGCFGDFIKLKPKTSFFKDVVLLVPALVFVFWHKKMHQLFTPSIRTMLTLVSIVGLFIYCLSNYYWNIPQTDFRPFKKGVDVRSQKDMELDAWASVPILSYSITNKSNGEQIELEYSEYMKVFQDYPSEDFLLEQNKGLPSIPITKIKDYEISSFNGDDVADDLLGEQELSIMIVSHKIKGTPERTIELVKDTIYLIDTLQLEGSDSLITVKRIDRIEEKEMEDISYKWGNRFFSAYSEVIKPFVEGAKESNIKVYMVSGGADENMVKQLQKDTGLNVEIYTADDILLKTIVRSNPGVVLWQNGRILDKWHYKKLPKFEQIKEKYLGK